MLGSKRFTLSEKLSTGGFNLVLWFQRISVCVTVVAVGSCVCVFYKIDSFQTPAKFQDTWFRTFASYDGTKFKVNP